MTKFPVQISKGGGHFCQGDKKLCRDLRAIIQIFLPVEATPVNNYCSRDI